VWIYGNRFGEALAGREWSIAFSYPSPINRITLHVRSNFGSDSFIHGEVFEQEVYKLPLSKPPSTILDLGANIGLSSVYFGRMYPDARIACVEPHPGNASLLRRNLPANGVRAEVVEAAIDRSDGRAMLELDRKDYGHRLAVGAASPAAGRIEVEAISVPTLCSRLGWDRIGLLKVDIEGHEKSLLAEPCEWMHRVDSMCIEWHYPEEPSAVPELAREFGLEPQQLRGIWFMSRCG